MRVLVIGGSGLIGSHLLREFRSRGHGVTGTYRQREEDDLAHLDADDLVEFEGLLDRLDPRWVIHAAGWTWVDGCEDDPDRAMEENCHQPVRLAELCHRRGIRFGYFSTSYIFDGRAGPYDEGATPRPINVYARSKWQAEQRLNEVTRGSVFLPRVICVYGVEARRKNFACQVCDAMRSGKPLVLPSDQIGNPTWAGDIARACGDLMEHGVSGPFHLAGAEPDCTRIRWAERLVSSFAQLGLESHRFFGLSSKPTALLGQKARRPLHAGLISRRMPRPHFPPTDNILICKAIAGI